MIRLPPNPTRTHTLSPYTTPFRSHLRHGPVRRSQCNSSGRTINEVHAINGSAGIGCVGVIDQTIGIDVDQGDIGGHAARAADVAQIKRSEEHTSELQSLMLISYAVSCLKNKKKKKNNK